jgi:hypothetical protein
MIEQNQTQYEDGVTFEPCVVCQMRMNAATPLGTYHLHGCCMACSQIRKFHVKHVFDLMARYPL